MKSITNYCSKYILNNSLKIAQNPLLTKSLFYLSSNTLSSLKEGDIYYNFRVKNVVKNNEFNIKIYDMEHEILKTKYIHFEKATDSNNTFGILVPTSPSDDKGLAHILEHVICMGSERYPVKDPFIQMTKRTLANHINAMTSFAWTFFTYSTTNLQDYQNLQDVVMNLVYYPLLKPKDIDQEAWHYILEDMNDINSSINLSGVVYNEMVGDYSNPNRLFCQQIFSNLLSNSLYEFDYGGHPNHIYHTTYEDIHNFYKKFYSPSNTTLFSYGNFNLKKQLKFLEKDYYKFLAKKYKKNKKIDNIHWSSNDYKPVPEKIIKIPESQNALNEAKQSKYALNFLCTNTMTNDLDNYSLKLLSDILLSYQESPLYKLLILSGLAPSYSPSCGYISQIKEGIFSLGVNNVSNNLQDIYKIEKDILSELERLVKEGIDKILIDISLHQEEIKSKKQDGNFGLDYVLENIGYLRHNVANFRKGLNISDYIKQIKEKLDQNIPYFENLIKTYLIDNPKRSRLIMIPNNENNFMTQILEKEKEFVKHANETFTLKQKAELQKILQKKASEHESQENNEALPMLKISEINKKVEENNWELINKRSEKIFFNHQELNGLTYLRFKINLNNLTEDELKFITFFCDVLPTIGTKDLNFMKFQTEIEKHLGQFSCQTYSQINGKREEQTHLCMTFKCLDYKIKTMFDLILKLFSQYDFNDKDNLSIQIEKISDYIVEDLVDNPLKYAISSAQGNLYQNSDFPNLLAKSKFMIDQCQSFSKILQQNQGKSESEFTQRFYDIMKKILIKKNVEIGIHSHEKNKAALLDQCERLIDECFKNQPTQTLLQQKNHFQKYEKQFFHLENSMVNYCAQSMQIPNWYHKQFPEYKILGNILQNSYVHQLVREQGGAYGAGVKVSPKGLFSFYSYRDPCTFQTFNAYKQSVQLLLDNKISKTNIKEATLNFFAQQDYPIPPQQNQLDVFLGTGNQQKKQEIRNKIFSISSKKLMDILENDIYHKMENNKTSSVIFGAKLNEDVLQKEGWKILKY